MKKIEIIKKQINDNNQSLIEEIESLQQELQSLQIEKENEIQQLKDEIKRLRNNSIGINKESDNNELIEENYEIKEINYQQIYPDNRPPFSWENRPQLLPTRLYNVKTGQVEETKEKTNIKKGYINLSYIWGEPGKGKILEKAEEKLESVWKNVEYRNKLNPLGYKVFKKGIETCQLMGIDYFWMDQLCINISNNEEKNREVAKIIKEYYSNATATLIAINKRLYEYNFENSQKKIKIDLEYILEAIVKSVWFSRTWTLQEGFLPKQTLFAFDDLLVDGRIMARMWALKQPSFVDTNKYNSFRECEGNEKLATPLGWVYYKGEYNYDDVASLRLNQALLLTKNRGRGIPVDGVYSILGLLPYGDQIRPRYKPRTCPECSNQEESESCQHEEKTKLLPKYTKKDVEKVLIDVIKTAVKNGYGEPLAWFGASSKSPSLCWIPQIDEHGSTNVEGGIEIHCKPESINFTDKGIEIIGSKYTISDVNKYITKFNEDLSVESGSYKGNVWVKILNNKEYNSEIITLLGAEETFDLIEMNDVLIIPSKKQWKSSVPFALLARREGEFYHRLGLVKLLDGAEKKLRGAEERRLIIGGHSEKVSDNSQYQTQIEIPPKS